MAKRRSMKKRAGRRTSKTYRSGGRISRKASMRKTRKEKKSKKSRKGKRKTYRKKSRKVMRGG